MGIQGFGGVGKSTIASHFYQYSNCENKFWADVKGETNFIYFAKKIIAKFEGKVPTISDNLNQTRATIIYLLIDSLIACLYQKRCLLIIDNLEFLIDKDRKLKDEGYQKFFQEWLTKETNSKLLITTQEIPKSLQNYVKWYFLKGMKLDEGVAFAEKLKLSGTQAEIESFVRFIDGHPLTLKLVASYLKNECFELKEIEEQFKLAYENAKGEHRKQEVYLEWIIQQHLSKLSTQDRNFLINLSVYRLSFNVEAASYMWFYQKKSKNIDKALKDLWHRSLLLKKDSIRLAEQIENLYAEAESRNSLANIFIDIQKFDDSLFHAKRAYNISNNLPQKGISSLNIGASYLLKSNYESANEFLNRSLNIARELHNIRLEADSLFNICKLFWKQNQVSEARKAIDEAERLYKEMGLSEKVENCNCLISQLDSKG